MGETVSLTEPIVEGAYYEREDGQVVGPPAKHSIEGRDVWTLYDWCYMANGDAFAGHAPRLKRRVYLVPTDPAEVVAELRILAGKKTNVGFESSAYNKASDLVAEKLGVKS